MSNIEKIKAEIERRIKAYKTKNGFPAGTICAIRIETHEGLLSFINSLPEEKPSEDLEKAANNIYKTPFGTRAEDFQAGAEWKKEQMMKDAVEGEIVKDITNKLAVTAKNINLDGFKFGDKVKIIIVKED